MTDRVKSAATESVNGADSREWSLSRNTYLPPLSSVRDPPESNSTCRLAETAFTVPAPVPNPPTAAAANTAPSLSWDVRRLLKGCLPDAAMASACRLCSDSVSLCRSRSKTSPPMPVLALVWWLPRGCECWVASLFHEAMMGVI